MYANDSGIGKRIVDLQTSLALAAQPRDPLLDQGPDSYGRYPYEHPLLEGVEHLSERQKSVVLSKNRLAQLGKEYGLDTVLRWKPKKADNLSGSGLELVMAQALYAIVGGVALERGGQLANKVTREKILSPLGVILPE
jgi:large subunit ribosomal protein L15